jgi:hypothetical protein
MMSIEQWTEASHDALIERLMDRGAASKTPTEYAAMVEIGTLRTELDVHKRYINRDIEAQIAAAFETKKATGKFPFED